MGPDSLVKVAKGTDVTFKFGFHELVKGIKQTRTRRYCVPYIFYAPVE